MDLRQLRYFSVLAEERHFRRAAQRLSLSQPPLSLAIRQLERSLGTKLFHRNSRNVELTAAGRALQREANHLLRRLDEARDLVMAVDQGHGGVLRIGFGGSTIYRALPKLIRQFKAAQPSIGVRLQELNSVEQVLALKRDDIDFGFINGRGLPSGLDGFRYWSEPFYACLPEGHARAKGRTVKLEDLAGEEFVMFGRSASPEYFAIIMDLCRSAGIEPTGNHEVRHWMSVISSVAHGLGVALVPRALKSSNVAGVVFLPLTGAKGVSETWCVWKNDRELSNGTKAFLSAARQNVSLVKE